MVRDAVSERLEEVKIRKRKKKRPTPSDARQTNAQPTGEKERIALMDFLDSGPKKAPRQARQSKIDMAITDAELRAQTGEWEGIPSRIFVGLYGLCHRILYGFVPDELKVTREFDKAAKMAARRLRESFDNDAEEMVEFIKWSWERQKSKEAWAINNGKNVSRLNIFAQFSPSLVSDYRKAVIDRARRNRVRK